MGEANEIEENDNYSPNSTAARFRCEDCGYKWQVRGFNEETDDNDAGTVYYDGNDDLEPTSCPMCGCADILSL